MTDIEFIEYMRAHPNEQGRMARDKPTTIAAVIHVEKDGIEVGHYLCKKTRVIKKTISRLIKMYKGAAIVVRHLTPSELDDLTDYGKLSDEDECKDFFKGYKNYL